MRTIVAEEVSVDAGPLPSVRPPRPPRPPCPPADTAAALADATPGGSGRGLLECHDGFRPRGVVLLLAESLPSPSVMPKSFELRV